MFTQKSFEIFSIDGLEARMAEIRSEIQPVFSEIGQKLLTKLSAKILNQEFYFHIAQHRRRTANAHGIMLQKILGQQFQLKLVVIKWKPISN